MSSTPQSDFIHTITFTDQAVGGITAKKLNIAWRDNRVSPYFVQRQPAIAGVVSTDYLLVLRNDGTYAKLPATAIGGGAAGPRGSYWYTGTGAPGTITGQQVQDQFLDTASGDTWQLQ
jgi:hypothetical protein